MTSASPPVAPPTPSDAWVVALSHEHGDNWIICREAGLYGTPNPRGGQFKAGDEIFIWQSKAGWLARCIAISDAYPVSATHPAPWTDGADYKWLIDISVAAEANPPIQLASPGGWQTTTGLHTTTFRSPTIITPQQATAVRNLFPGTPPALTSAPRVAAKEPAAGWGPSQDRERNKLIEQAGIDETIRHFEGLGYTLTADRQLDGVGYDIEMSNGIETLHIEAKGIASFNLAFNLTEKEFQRAGDDDHFRLSAVTDALGTPQVSVMTGPEMLALRITPTQYRVRQPSAGD